MHKVHINSHFLNTANILFNEISLLEPSVYYTVELCLTIIIRSRILLIMWNTLSVKWSSFSPLYLYKIIYFIKKNIANFFHAYCLFKENYFSLETWCCWNVEQLRPFSPFVPKQTTLLYIYSLPKKFTPKWITIYL